MALNIFNPNNGRGGVFAQGDASNDIVATWVLETSNLGVNNGGSLSGPIDLSGNDTILGLAGDDVIVDLSQANDGRGGNYVFGGKGSDRMVVKVGGNLLHGDQSKPGVDLNATGVFAWGDASDTDHAQYHFMDQGIRVGTVNEWSTLGQELKGADYGFSATRSAYVVDLNGSSNTYAAIQGSDVDNALKTLKVDLLLGIESLVGTKFDDAFLLQHGAHDVAVDSGKGNDWIEKAAGDARLYAGEGNDTVTLGTVYGSSDGVRIVDGGKGHDGVVLNDKDTGLLIEGVNPWSALGQALEANTQNHVDTWNGKEWDATSNYTVVENGLPVNAYAELQAGAYGGNNAWLGTTAYFFEKNADDAGIDRAELLVNVEKITGTAKNDTFLGRGGVDKFDGGAGDDYIDGRAGLDVFTGGAGNDTFAFSTTQEKGNGYTVTITDFDAAGDDTLRVSTTAFDDGFAFLSVSGGTTSVTFSPVDDANRSIATAELAGYDWTATGLTKAEWIAANIDFV
jgi:Ca2+-binding RTX toxin-like protein